MAGSILDDWRVFDLIGTQSQGGIASVTVRGALSSHCGLAKHCVVEGTCNHLAHSVIALAGQSRAQRAQSHSGQVVFLGAVNRLRYGLRVVMPLPKLSPDGLLPEGVHPATDEELCERFVESFPQSRERRSKFNGLKQLQAAIEGFGANATQWIDGSFVDGTRLNPSDIDVATILSAEFFNALSQEEQGRMTRLIFGGDDLKMVFDCHTFPILERPIGHPLRFAYEKRSAYFRDLFSKVQRYDRGPKRPAPERGRKGFVQMTIGDATLAPRPVVEP